MKPTNRRTCTTTFLAASLVAFAALGASAAPSYKATLTVSGYTGSTTLENFPVLVRITEYDFSTGRGIEGFSYSDCAADGADLSFVAADGETILPHEIDTWETTGESLVWVRLPSLSGTDTTFTMRWADDDPPPVTKSDVWTGAGYKSVWHLDIANSATADAVAGYAGTVRNPSAYCGAGAGLLGGGYHNEDNVDNCHNVYTTNVAGFTPVSGTATYSAWAKQIGGTAANGFPDQATYPKIKWASSWGNCGAIWNSKDGGNKVGIGTGGIELCLEGKANMINTMYVRDSKATIGTLTMDTIYDKQWHYLVVTYDGTTRRFYVDGVIQPRFTGSYTIDTPEGTVRMGARADDNKDCVWTGDLDEMRFRGACSSADWISAEYANIASDTFIVYGPAQAGDNSVWVKGSPSEIGAPTPAYGFTTGLSAGDPVVFSVAETVVAGSGTSTNYLAGWIFEAVDTETRARTPIASSEDPGATIDSYSGTFASYSEFTWLWEKRDAFGVGAITVAANGGSYLDLAVDVTGLGYAAGGSATLTVEYGTTSDLLDHDVSKAVTSLGNAIVRIQRLQPNTPYFFKATLDDGNGVTAETAVTQLTTSVFSTGKRRIEYVEGTGTQWIDTGYTPTPSTRTVMDFQFTDTTAQARVFGIGIGDLIYTAYINGNGYYGYSLADTGTWMAIDALNRVDMERHLYDFNYIDGNDNHAYTVYSTNGTSLTVSPLEGTATKTATYTLPLGAWRFATSADTPCINISKHRIYSARIYEGNELKFALSPIASDSGAVMFYESVSKRTFSSAGIKVTDLAYTDGGPAVSAFLSVVNGERLISLSFLAAPFDRPLRIAYGPVFGGDDPADWATTAAVATVPCGATSATVQLPATWGEDSALVARCYFDDGTDFPLWSDAIAWLDDSVPVLSNVDADGSGGDQLVVTGTLASFSGDDCTLTVYTGASIDNLTETWSGLSGSIMTEAGDFSLTLYESDTSASRYITPGSPLFVVVDAVSGGKTGRSNVMQINTKGAPVFGDTSANDFNNITFTGNLTDLGAGGSAVVTLYVGTANNDASLEAVETPKTITGTGNFTFEHAFPALNTTYYWQFRAVSTTTGGETPLESRSVIKTCKQNDKATYTWKADANGNWNGDWADPAHWDASASPNKGYPQSANNIAQFSNCTLEHLVVVTVTNKYTLGRLRCWGRDNGSKIVFAGTGRDTSGFKSAYDQSAIASNTEVEFRDMTVTASGNWELLRNTDKTNVTVRVVRSNMAVGQYFALSAKACRLEVLDGSEFSAPQKLNMGGVGTVLLVDDSTVTAAASNMGVIFNADTAAPGEIEVRLRGRNAKINAGSFYTYSRAPGDYGGKVILEVPKEGFASAPIEMTSTTRKFGELGNGSGIPGKKIIFEVDAQSPALVQSRKLLENIVVVDSTKPNGIDTTHVSEGIGSVPRDSGVFKYDDAENPQKILLDLQGYRKSPMVIMVR